MKEKGDSARRISSEEPRYKLEVVCKSALFAHKSLIAARALPRDVVLATMASYNRVNTSTKSTLSIAIRSKAYKESDVNTAINQGT
jgi:hypothetical protein